ncbi:hypothetical protein ABZP36_020797 [Zizania latifolia]
MQSSCINLTQAARHVQLFRIDGHSATWVKVSAPIASCRIAVGGYDWAIDYYPNVYYCNESWIKLGFTMASDGAARGVVATFRCRLVDQSGVLKPSGEKTLSCTFSYGLTKEVHFMRRFDVNVSGYVQQDDSILLECAITVLLDAAAAAAAAAATTTSVAAPPSDLQRHFGEMLRSQKGADVTFLVSGESVAAHRCVLAARSPVFMAELFGDMEEKDSERIEIKGMEAEVFRALLHFIYTDTLPEQDEEDARTMAQHLLDAADRYGMERLKLICADKVCAGISVDTVATSLAMAEQHGCSKLKARCIEFILATPANFQAVAATEGYKFLTDVCPSVLNDLILAIFARYKPFRCS